jgi:hypothetical protein
MMQPPGQFAQHIFDAAIALLKRPGVYWPFIAGAVGMIAPWVRKWRRKWRSLAQARTVRDWLSVQATIDVVSVAERQEDKKRYYAAVLTYFYRRLDLQMGEYEREFSQRPAAKQWADQFKGRHVTVHVNPENPSESFLLDCDLQGLDAHLAPSIEAPSIETLPALPHSYYLFCELSELLSIAGLATSAVLLSVSIATGDRVRQHWVLWAGAAIFAITWLSMFVVQLHFRGNESAKSFLHTYTLWCPAWMRWGLKVSGAAFGLFLILGRFRADLPLVLQPWMNGFAPHMPYVVACWGFLLSASFHAAVLRSQEEGRIPGGGA